MNAFGILYVVFHNVHVIYKRALNCAISICLSSQNVNFEENKNPATIAVVGFSYVCIRMKSHEIVWIIYK